jgi:hypothetical protein
MFTTFDAPSGEACVARRETSNTPLQALTLLNDSVFTEAAQALGRLLAANQGTDDDRIRTLFLRCLSRPPNADETAALKKFLAAQKNRFTTKELDANSIAGPGEGNPFDRAIWTTAARAILNLDEAITKG